MTTVKDGASKSFKPTKAEQGNREWWESNPMTYDWEKTLGVRSGTLEWYGEIDRRFLDSAYYAIGKRGEPFARFLSPELVRGKQVLEIGCGMGTHAEMLIRNGAKLTAIDQTSFAIGSTQKRLRLKQMKGNISQQDAENLSFRNESFDVVWTWGVIHHSRSTERCVDHIAGVLRPGGHLMMMVYYRPSLVYYLHCGFIRGVLMGKLMRQSVNQIYVESTDGFYARVFTKSELRQLLSKNFHSIRMSVVGLKAELYPIPRNKFKVALERATPDWFARGVLGTAGSMIVVEATRS